MKTIQSLLLLLLCLAAGAIMFYITFSWPKTWAVPYWVGRLPAIPLFWLRFIIVGWIVIIGTLSYLSVKRQEKKQSDEFDDNYIKSRHNNRK